MIKHTLICSLHNDKNSSFKSLKLSSEPSIDKIRETYFHNAKTLKYVLNYCIINNIKSLRVISSLFPLASHIKYRKLCEPLLEEVSTFYNNLDYSNIELSSHPDQFILLSSLNPNINENSRYELEIYGYMSSVIPWNLVNIHVGSKAGGFETHSKILKSEIKKLSSTTKSLISLENDEKSYSFEETLKLSQDNEVMCVPDFHHERCFQKRNLILDNNDSHFNTNKKSDDLIYKNLENIKNTYRQNVTPLFHISSPKDGWSNNFKENCIHADYINKDDYPIELTKIECRLDIEAKHKNLAIAQIEKDLSVLV